MTLTADEIDILERVVSKNELEPIFFKKIKGIKWFDALVQYGFFHSSKNPRPIPAKQEGYISIPFWPVIDYLVSISPELAFESNKSYAKKILEILCSCTTYASANQYTNYRTWWQFSKIIQHIPIELINEECFLMIDYWLNDDYENSLVANEIGENWLPTLVGKKDKSTDDLALKLIELLFKINFRVVDGKKNKEACLRIKEWNAQQIIDKFISDTSTAIKPHVADFFKERLENLLLELGNDQWSYVWRPAIEDNIQNQTNTHTEDVFLVALRDTLLSWMNANPLIAREYLDGLLDSNYQLFKRIAIYVSDVNFEQLKSCIEKILIPNNFEYNLQHELWNFLNRNFNKLTDIQKDNVLRIICDKTVFDENNTINDRSSAYHQAIWLASIKDNNQDLKAMYERLTEKAGCEPDHPDFNFYHASSTGYKTPISKELLFSLEIDDLVNQLNNFEPTGGFFDSSIEGLAQAFKQCIVSFPLKYHYALNDFVNIKLAYAHSIITGYKDLWSEKKQLPWNDIWTNLLSFCYSLVKRDGFWIDITNKDNRGFYANSNWIVADISRLIEAGTKSDDHSFDESLIGIAKEILIIILDNQEGAEFEASCDAVSITINSPRGQCLEALINLSLRTCRLDQKKSNCHIKAWETFVSFFDIELQKISQNQYEFAALVTLYFPNFLFMSKDWTVQNLPNIFNTDNYIGWLCAMQGYAHSNNIYEQVYKFLVANAHLKLSLDNEHFDERTRHVFIHHISIAFLDNYESLEDSSSLINYILDRNKFDEISELIWSIWVQRKNIDAILVKRIMVLWIRVSQKINTTTIEGKKLASNLCMWSDFIDEVNNDNRFLLLDIAPYANENHHAYHLIQSIARISEKQPKEAYLIWMKILESDTPEFPPEEIKLALLNINKDGSDGRRNAKTIVSKYIATGNDQLNQWLNSANMI